MMATYALLAWGRVSGNVGIVNRYVEAIKMMWKRSFEANSE